MRLFSLKILLLILQMLSALGVAQEAPESRGIMENINEGIRFAGQMFGINTAADVANLVARAFSNNKNNRRATMPPPTNSEQYVDGEQEKQQEPEPTHRPSFNVNDLLTNVLRLVGFDVNKLGALALNAIILIAQAISNGFIQQPLADNGEYYAENQAEMHAEGRESRGLRGGTPLDWFLESPTPNMRQMLDNALNGNITERLVNMITQMETEKDQGGCLKMLVCRSSPFIWGMQRSVKQGIDARNQTTKPTSKIPNKNIKDSLYAHMPTLEEYRQHAEMCAHKYAKNCQLSVDTNIK